MVIKQERTFRILSSKKNDDSSFHVIKLVKIQNVIMLQVKFDLIVRDTMLDVLNQI